ncbi:HAD-like protein, partial [Auricularia subglabra TFB-10046 SS5]
ERERERLLGCRKLSLVVDLDNTIVHTIVVRTDDERMARMQDHNHGSTTFTGSCRPGLRAFLQTISEKYEPTVYTMGTRGYAEKVCAAVDGDERVFGGRIFSRDENEGNSTKSLSRLFPPCDKSMTAIIDDSRKVWEDKKNIVSVQPYVFFGDCDS